MNEWMNEWKVRSVHSPVILLYHKSGMVTSACNKYYKEIETINYNVFRWVILLSQYIYIKK
jgi:hypothetical protein